MGRQSNNHYSWVDIQSRDLVVVFFQFSYQYYAGMGQREKVIAHTSWIQYHVDMVESNGFSTEYTVNYPQIFPFIL